MEFKVNLLTWIGPAGSGALWKPGRGLPAPHPLGSSIFGAQAESSAESSESRDMIFDTFPDTETPQPKLNSTVIRANTVFMPTPEPIFVLHFAASQDLQ